MEINKAVITAAAKSQATLPLQTLVDRDGVTKAALQIILEEVLATGVQEVCVVVRPGDQAAYASAAGPFGSRLQFVEQRDPRGYGHAVFCARDFLANEPFLLLVGDHLYVSRGDKRCAEQLVATAAAENCAVSAVQATHESKLPFYGAIGGHLAAGRNGVFEISDVAEKPTPTEAEQRLIVPGLRAGHYLCFFGMHVLTPALIAILEAELSASKGNLTLSSALARLARRERYLAAELHGARYDIGVKYGLLTAQMALAVAGKDRDEVLSVLLELLARRETSGY